MAPFFFFFVIFSVYFFHIQWREKNSLLRWVINIQFTLNFILVIFYVFALIKVHAGTPENCEKHKPLHFCDRKNTQYGD